MPILKDLQKHKLLLDTHVWVWLINGDLELSASFNHSVLQAEKQDGLFISIISIWEIGMLESKGRLQFEMDCQDWIDALLEHSGVSLAPMSPKIAIDSSRLPGECHGDPADRLLIATAYELRAVLVTADRKLLEYGRTQHLNVFDPT